MTWLLSVDAIMALTMIVLWVAFWRAWSRRRREPDEIIELAIGQRSRRLLRCCSCSAAAGGGHRREGVAGVGTGVPAGQRFLLGYALLFPIGLALYSRASPRAIGGLMIGVYYLSLFLANMAVGRSADCWRPSAVDRSGSCTRA